MNINPYESPSSLDRTTFKSLQKLLPFSVYLGLLFSIASIGLWTAWFFTRSGIFLFIAIPFKLGLFVTPVIFYQELSKLLYQRTTLAAILGLTLIASTVFAGAAYLPYRETFIRKIANDACYSFSTNPGRVGDWIRDSHKVWLDQWNRRIPHAKEVFIAVVFFSGILTVCTLFRLNLVGGIVLTICSYVWLLMAPNIAGLVSLDFDFFLKGIVFDHISLDFIPILGFFAGPHSIFLFVFYFLFFSICALFISANHVPAFCHDGFS